MGSRRRRLAWSIVLMVGAIACKLAIEAGTVRQAAISFPANTAFNTTVNGIASVRITIAPANDKISSNDKILAIRPALGDCANWKLNLPTLPANVTSSCSSGTGTGTATPQSAGSSCAQTVLSFTPDFNPKDPGLDTCVLTIETDTAGPATMTLTGNATPLAVDLRLAAGFADPVSCNPCSANFGDVDVGLPSTPVNLEIRNLGSAKATITKLDTAAPFAVVGTSTDLSVAAGEKLTVQATCTPTSQNPAVGMLAIQSDNANTEIPQTLALACRGVQSNLQFLSGSSSIGQIDLTTRLFAEQTQTVTLKNNGTGPMTISSFDLSVPTVQGELTHNLTLPATLAVGQQKDVDITYFPQQVTPDLGNLTVVFNGGDRALALSGSALEATVETTLTPTTLGKLCIGDTRPVDVRVRANGDAGFDLVSVNAKDSDHAEAFDLMFSTPPPFTLDPRGGNELVFTVVAAPTSLENMSIVLNTDIPSASSPERPGMKGSSPIVVDLPAEILPLGVAGPGPAVFEPVELRSEEFSRAIEISNCDETAVAISGATVTNADFEIVAGDFTEIPPRGTVTYQIAMKTDTPGPKVATLRVVTAADSIDVPLSGEVLGADPRDSYYACSTGNPGGWLLVLGGLGFVLRRRRRAA